MRIIVCLFGLLVPSVMGDLCERAQVDAVGFTTDDATIVTRVAFIADFTIACANGVKDISLYANKGDGIMGVARSVDGLKYQVSWVEDVASASSGEREIKLYDEQGYAAFKKAHRMGEETETVHSIASIRLYHPGTYKGPWVNSETLAVLGAILVFYFAFSNKTKLMA